MSSSKSLSQQKVQTPLRQLIGLKESIIALLFIWVIGFTPFISSLDYLFYDYYNSVTPASSAVQPSVLLIEADYDAYAQPEAKIQMEQVARKLLENDAAQLVFLFDPQLSADFYTLPQVSGKLVIGRLAMADANKKQIVRLMSKPTPFSHNVPIGIVSLPYPQSGIYREQYSAVKSTEGMLPAIEMLAAKGRGISVFSQTYWVDFVGGITTLPRLSIAQAVQGNIVPELIKGRSIVIGLTGGNAQVGIHYPGSYGHATASANEFHSFALNTLLNNSAVEPFSSIGRLSLLALISLFVVVIFQLAPIHLAPVLTLGMIGFCSALTWLLLVLLHKWAPLADLICLQVLLCAIFIRCKNRNESEHLERMMLDTSVRLRDLALPDSFKDSTEHWAHLVAMVRQMLALKRTIFLERIEGDHRLQEVEAFNCHIQDIKERRRDYERTPYTTAIQHGGALVVKDYLQLTDKEECTLLIPLVFAGDILGFWVMGVSYAVVDSADFNEKVRILTEQISVLLFQRQLARSQLKADQGNWAKHLVNRQTVIFAKLQHSALLFSQKNEALTQAFHDMATAAILYDLFGRALLVNHHMNDLLRRSDINPYTLMAADLIALLTGKDMQTVQSYIQHCIFDQLHMSLPISLRSQDTHYYLLNLRALKTETHGKHDFMPFQIKGLLIELVDLTAVHQLQLAKQELLSQLKYAYRNDLGAFMAASSILRDETLLSEQKIQVLNMMDEKIVISENSFNEIIDFLSLDFFDSSIECYPVEMLRMLNDAVERHRVAVNNRNVSISSKLPQLDVFAMASSTGANEVIQAILTYMIEAALDDTVVDISLTYVAHDVIFTFANTGIGMPNERLHDFLYGASEPNTKQLKRLRKAIHLVGLWDGNIQATSIVGCGVNIALTLKRFRTGI